MQTKTLSTLFRFSMWWRIFYGSVRTVLGIMLLKLINVPFSDILYNLLQYEVSEEPTNQIVRYIDSFLQAHPFTVTGFLAAYLIFWGVLDVFLSVCLLQHRWWAFPVSLSLIALFVFYEVFRFTYTHSLILLSVIIIDIFIYWIIRREHIELHQHPEHLNQSDALP